MLATSSGGDLDLNILVQKGHHTWILVTTSGGEEPMPECVVWHGVCVLMLDGSPPPLVDNLFESWIIFVNYITLWFIIGTGVVAFLH